MKQEVIDKASNIFEFENLIKRHRTNEMELAWRLYCIRETKSYDGRYTSFSEMLDTLQIRRDAASRMCTVIEQYVITYKVAASQLSDISINWLYEGRKLLATHPTEKVLAMAKTNTLQELRDTKQELDNPNHEHTPKDDLRYAWCDCGKLYRI